MSYIINNTNPFVSIKLTEKGREQLAQGQLNFSFWAIGDSELNYGREAIVDANPTDVTLSATSKIMRPFDRQPNFKSYITPAGAITPFQTLTNANINVIKAVVNNEATERGFFSVSGNVYTTLTGETYSPYNQAIPNTNISGGTILGGLISTSGFSVGDIMLLKSINNLVSGSAYSLGTATGFVALANNTLTLSTGSQFFTTGNIGEATLVGTPTFGTGSNLGSSPSAVADFVSLYNSLILLTGTTIITPSDLGSNNYGNGVGVFVPGVYSVTGAINTTVGFPNIILSGAGDYVFISYSGALTTANPVNIILTGGATSDRVFWVMGAAITTGANGVLKGNFMSGPAANITIGSTNTLDGRLLSQNDIVLDATASTFAIPSGSTSSGSSSTSIGFSNVDAIPNLWFKIQGLSGNSITLDRNLPNYSAYTTDSIIIIYRGGEVYNSIATGDTTAYWDSGTLSFNASNNITCHDVPVWNMNNVWCENLAGMTGLTTPSPLYEDYTKFGSYQYLGTKNPYLEYLCVSTADTLNFNCNGPGFSYPDDVTKAISILHYTNNTISSLYGEYLYIDTTNNKMLEIYLPILMYHRRGYTTGSGTTMGMRFISSGATQLVGNSDIEYIDLIEDVTLLSSGNTTPLVVGRVYPQLKTVVIHDEEIVAAISYKSNRNWTLPALAAVVQSPSSGISTGVLDINSTIYLSYSLENTGGTGLTTSLPNQEYIKVTNNSSSAKDIAFRISDVDLLPYMRKYESSSYDGLGFYAKVFKLIYQIVQDPNERPDPGAWKSIDFTSAAITGVLGETIDPKLLETQTPTTTGFILTKINDSGATTFDIIQSLNMAANNSPSSLQFGDERFFYGNLTTFIGATIYKTMFDINVSTSTFNTTSNPTRSKDPSTNPPNIKVSEVGIYDSANNLVCVGKLSTPVALQTGNTIMIELSIDF